MRPTPAEERLAALLANYEHETLPCSQEDSAIALVEVTRALDAAAYSSVLEEHPDETEHDRIERRTRIIGAATALRPLLATLRDEPCDFPLVYSTDESLAWADNHLLGCGLYANALRLAAFERYGLATTKFVTPEHLVIEVNGREAEAEHREIAIGRFLQNQVSDEDARHLAYRRAQRFFEAEALPIDALIGGRTFGDWCKASAAASGRVLQHIAYATRLKRRHPRLHLRDLLTIYSRREDVSEVIFLHGDEVDDQVPSLLRAMTLDEGTANQCIAETEIPYPLHIEFGRDMVLLPCFGALLNPMTFVVRFLRARYRSDWDRAVDRREEAFRASLRDVLPEPRFHIAERGPKLRRPDGSVITDVDAVIVDREFGSLALVQLKWADVHGRSLAERESRRRNLLKANEWVDRVVTWIDARSAAEIGAALRLEGVGSQRPPHVFVISRYSSQFTRNDPYDRRAAWFSWLDLLLGVPANLESDLLDRLSESFRGGVTFPPNEEQSMHVTKLQFPGLLVELRVF
jgi:hypothetical protein